MKKLKSVKVKGSTGVPPEGGTTNGVQTSALAPVKVEQELRYVKWGALMRSPTNPRKEFQVEDLVENVKMHGIIQPLIVRRLPRWELQEPDLVTKAWRVLKGGVLVESFDSEAGDGSAMPPLIEGMARSMVEEGNRFEFEIVAGERRHRAAEVAGLEVVPVIVRDLTDVEVTELQWIENLQREGLSPQEEVEGYRKLVESGAYTAESLAVRLGVKRSTIFARLKLARLTGPVAEAWKAGKIDASVAGLLARIPGVKLQGEALEYIMDEKNWHVVNEDHNTATDEYGATVKVPMSFRQVKAYLENNYVTDLEEATFDRTRVYFRFGPKVNGFQESIEVSPCGTCPRRSGNCREEFPDITSADICTDPECFAWKTKRHVEVLTEELTLGPEPRACEVLTGKAAQAAFDYEGEPELRKGYVAADTKVPGTSKTVKEALKKSMPLPVIAIVDGKEKKIYRVEDVERELVMAGVKAKSFKQAVEKQTTTQDYAKQQKEREERVKKATAVFMLAREKILPLARKEVTTLEVLRLTLGNNRFWALARLTNRDEDDIKEAALKMNEKELRELLFDSVLCQQSVDHTGEFREELLERCKRFKVDLKKLAEELPLEGETEKAVEQKGAKVAKKGGKKK